MVDEDDGVKLTFECIKRATPVEDRDVLQYVRSTRLAILEKQLANGIDLSEEGFEQVHKNLVELDKSAYTNLRLAQDQTASDNANEIARLTAESIIKSSAAIGGVFKQGTGTIPNPEQAIAGEAEVITGELSVGDDARNFDDFMAGVGEKIQERVKSGELILSQVMK